MVKVGENYSSLVSVSPSQDNLHAFTTIKARRIFETMDSENIEKNMNLDRVNRLVKKESLLELNNNKRKLADPQ